MPHKILLINNGYPTNENPKRSSYIKNIYDCLIKADMKVDLLVLDSNFKSRKKLFIKYLDFYFRILKFRKFNDYDFVIVNNYPHCSLPLFFKLNKIKNLIIHWHGEDILNPTWKQFIFNLIYYFIKKNVKHISPSRYFAQFVSKRLNIPVEDVFVSPSGGIDVEKFKGKEIEKDYKVIKLGFASALMKNKGIDLIIELLKSTGNIERETDRAIEFHYIEYGRESGYYNKLLAQFQHCKRWDVLRFDKMHQFYNSINILLFPTKGESLGLVALEAMSCGVPVVGTDDFALIEYVIPGVTGERFKKGDKDSFIESVVKCIKNIHSYQSRAYVIQNYSKDKVAKDYKAFFSKIKHTNT